MVIHICLCMFLCCVCLIPLVRAKYRCEERALFEVHVLIGTKMMGTICRARASTFIVGNETVPSPLG